MKNRCLPRCYITGAGEFCETILPGQGDFIIAADGGYEALVSRGIEPDLIVGDFDSLATGLLDIEADDPRIIRSNVEKDDTDMMLAVKQGLSRGYKIFILNGGAGGRLDHTVANMQILTYIAENNARGTLLGDGIFITAVKNDEIKFDERMLKGSTISIFCAGDKAEGITLKGLKYPLKNATLTSDYPLGVSNEFTGAPAVISVRSGTLLIIWEIGGKVRFSH